MTNEILDIHTHRHNPDGKCIIDYQQLTDLPLSEGHYYSIGIHPWTLTAFNMQQRLDFIMSHLPNDRMVAIGEGGLDKLIETPMELQLKALMLQADLSEKNNLPLIIHCVKAVDRLLAVKKQINPRQPWIWHGFRGKPEQAVQLLEKGFYLSFGEHYQEDAMKTVPNDRLFLETDNSRLCIEDILQRAAEVRGVDVEALRDTVGRNVQNVFFKG